MFHVCLAMCAPKSGCAKPSASHHGILRYTTAIPKKGPDIGFNHALFGAHFGMGVLKKGVLSKPVTYEVTTCPLPLAQEIVVELEPLAVRYMSCSRPVGLTRKPLVMRTGLCSQAHTGR